MEFSSPSTVRPRRRPDTLLTGACLRFLPELWFVYLKSIRLVECGRLVSLTGARANYICAIGALAACWWCTRGDHSLVNLRMTVWLQ